MRTLLEKAREAQALRVASDPAADISHVTIEDIVLATGQKLEDDQSSGRRGDGEDSTRWLGWRR